jgi:hypothetical protein
MARHATIRVSGNFTVAAQYKSALRCNLLNESRFVLWAQFMLTVIHQQQMDLAMYVYLLAFGRPYAAP